MPTKTNNIISWILAGLLAIAFMGAGMTKLIGVEMQLNNLNSWGYPLWTRFPIGLAEIAMATGLLIPKYRTIAAMSVLPWAIVAIITHLQASPAQTTMIGAPLVFAGLAIGLLVVERRKK
jgi:putative oxidoreductase